MAFSAAVAAALQGRAGQGLGLERLGAGQRSSPGPGAGRAQAGCRAQAHRAGLQDSILRFSRPENLKNHVFATF